MKKILKLLLAVLMVVSLTACTKEKSTDFDPVAEWGTNVLNVYNWGEYIDKSVLTAFEKKYNCKINYSLFTSNEEMYTKLMSGASYDILVPSDYMIERLIDEKLIQKLDKSLIDKFDVLTDGVKNLDCDPNNDYMVPYFWGSVGLVYDTNVISEEEMAEKGWSILQDSKYAGKVYMYDSERDSFMIAFKALGYSMNTDNEAEIQEAYNWLRKVDKNLAPVAYVTDEVIDAMIDGEKAIAVVYSGDGCYIISENEDMGFFEPTEGTNIWCDGMVIPSNATNVKGAHAFINFVLEYDNAYATSEEVGYTSPVAKVMEDITAKGGAYYENDAYLPRVGYEKDENFHNNEVLKKTLSELWIKVKLHE